MSNYVRIHNFTNKDNLETGHPEKLIRGSEVDAELNAIAASIPTKFDADNIATQGQAQAADLNTVLMTPLRVQQWYNSRTLAGLSVLGRSADSTGGMAAITASTEGRPLRSNGGVLGFGTLPTSAIDSGTFADARISQSSVTQHNAALVHNTLSGVVANEHVDHSTVSVIAGNGMTGGGTIAANRTLTVGQGTGISVSSTAVALDTGHSRNADHSAISISAGTGLSGGGTIAANRTLSLDTSHIRNVDHSAVSISAGNGLTGGGTIASTRTLTLGTPSTLDKGTSNGVTASSHTHNIDSSVWDTATRSTGSSAQPGQVHARTANTTIPTAATGNWTAVYNNSSSSINLTQGSGLTLRLAGTSSTGTRTLAARGLAVIWYNSATEAVVAGMGVG